MQGIPKYHKMVLLFKLNILSLVKVLLISGISDDLIWKAFPKPFFVHKN